MERREQYDPEDIESLLQERSFDELLEEERAYVLRHLSGREEYEQMRALLRHVREDDRRHAPIEADDRVRANVMQAFRAQQQPQWRIWLNSIGGIFTPGEGYAMWRPALALGMLLVLFGIGFWLITGPLAGPTNEELAEVRRQKAEEPLPVKKAEVGDTVRALQRSTQAEGSQEQEKEEFRSALSVAKEEAPAPLAETRSVEADVVEDMNKVPDGKIFQQEVAEAEAGPQTDDAVQFAPASSGHVVTSEELARNQSVANATGAVQVKSIETKPARGKEKNAFEAGAGAALSRSVADDPQLLELLSAGW